MGDDARVDEGQIDPASIDDRQHLVVAVVASPKNAKFLYPGFELLGSAYDAILRRLQSLRSAIIHHPYSGVLLPDPPDSSQSPDSL